MKLIFSLDEADDEHQPASIFKLFKDHEGKYDGYDYLMLATWYLQCARDELQDYIRGRTQDVPYRALADIEKGAEKIIYAWLLLKGHKPDASYLATFLQHAQEPIRTLAYSPISRFFYLQIQLTTHPEALDEMGWRTDWTDEETRETVANALSELGLAIAHVREIAFQASGRRPKNVTNRQK
jgi:hypothetical protein